MSTPPDTEGLQDGIEVGAPPPNPRGEGTAPGLSAPLTDPTREAEASRLKAEAFAREARSANTRRTYRSAYFIYRAWCERLGFDPLSGDPNLIGMYVAGLPEQGLRLSTIRLRLSAIAAAHRGAGHSLDLKHPRIARVMEGIARTLGSRPTPVAPVLAEDLVAMMRAVPSTPLGIRDRALLLIGFGAALRRSELAALDLADVTVTDSGVKVLIASSKGDQEGKGQEVGIHRSADPLLCPARAFDAWLELRGAEPGPLFFRFVRGGGFRRERLSDKGVARIVKTAAVRIGLDPDRYAGHSLRAGLATSASNAGAELLHIMNQTRHKSVDTVRRYVRDADIWRNNVSRLVLPQVATLSAPPPAPIEAPAPAPAHPVFPQPDDLDTAIWRYLTFEKFDWLLRESRLYMASAADLGDPLEGTSPGGQVKFWNDAHERTATDEIRETIIRNQQFIRDAVEQYRLGYYVSCWRLGAGDSQAMWRCYAPDPNAVAIHSTYRALRAQVPSYAFMGVVRYIDYGIGSLPTMNLLEYITHKDLFWDFEREVRVVVKKPWDKDEPFFQNHFESTATPGRFAHAPSLDLVSLIRGVVLHPDATAETENLIGDHCRRFGLPTPKRSRQHRPPIF